jgi:hypothetical protein
MGVLIAVVLVIIIGVCLWLLFKVLTWVLKKRERSFAILVSLICIVLGTQVYQCFFVKTEFIQSEVYPNLYLVKNPSEDINIINKAIREKVIQLTNQHDLKVIQSYPTLSFYKYSKGDWGENGTAYFIKHKERRDGMTAELLEYYPECLLAEFIIQPCKKNTINFYGKLDYYHETKRIKTDTLLNSCIK